MAFYFQKVPIIESRVFYNKKLINFSMLSTYTSDMMSDGDFISVLKRIEMSRLAFSKKIMVVSQNYPAISSRDVLKNRD